MKPSSKDLAELIEYLDSHGLDLPIVQPSDGEWQNAVAGALRAVTPEIIALVPIAKRGAMDAALPKALGLLGCFSIANNEPLRAALSTVLEALRDAYERAIHQEASEREALTAQQFKVEISGAHVGAVAIGPQAHAFGGVSVELGDDRSLAAPTHGAEPHGAHRPLAGTFLNAATTTRTWILVSGTGTDPLPDSSRWVAERLGTALADGGYGLKTGGWPGVDSCAASAFAEAFRRIGRSPQGFLIEFVTAIQRGSAVSASEVQEVPKGVHEWADALHGTNAVVLIGGVGIAGFGGTLKTYRHARDRRIPVFPVPRTSNSTYRAARVAYDEILSHWETDTAFKRLSVADFRDLDVAVDVERDADRVVKTMMRLLERELRQG
jgi:hypothetical protein